MTAKLAITGLCKSFGDLEVLRNIGFQIKITNSWRSLGLRAAERRPCCA